MGDERRKLGIDALSDVAWGTHLCMFYETSEDLVSILALYFKAGLENNECCMWVTSGPLEPQEARAALNRVVNNLDSYIERGQIEILDAAEWYKRSDQSEAEETLQGLVVKEQQAIESGFDGLRLSGNMFWLEENDWRSIVEHEVAINNIVSKHRVVAICSYPVAGCEIAKVLDVANSHQLALVRRAGKWTAIESADRRWAEEELRESEERFRSLVEATSDWIWEVDANGTYTYAGPRVKDLLGYEPSEVIGKKPFDFMPTEEAKRVADEFTAIVKSGRPFSSLENLKLRKDGRMVMIETSGVPIFDSEGKLRGYRGIDRDITERKQAEEALRKSEAQYRLLFENANEAIAVVCEGKLCFVNPKHNEIGGYSEDELTSRPFVDFVHPDDREMIIERHEQRLKGEPSPGVYPIRILDKDGNTKWMEVNTVLISWEDKPATLTFSDDITKRKLAEDALQTSEEKKRAMFEAAAEGIAVTDIEGNVLETNEAAVRMYRGSNKEELVGRNGFELVSPKDLARSTEDFNMILREGHIGTREYTFLRKDGTEYPGEVNVSLIRDASGKPSTVICISRDITERKRMEEALRKSEAEYRLLVENANEAISVVCDGKLVFANPKATELTAYLNEELMSSQFIDLIHPDDRKMAVEVYEQMLRNEGLPAGYAIRFVDKHGNTKWVEANAVLISWGGRPAILTFSTDITERKRVEDSLGKSETRFRDLADLLPEAVYELDLDGKFTFANRRALELSGYSQEDLDRGLNALQVFIPEDRARVKQNIAWLLAGKDLGLQEYTAQRKDGSRFSVMIHSACIVDNGKVVGLRGIIIDITEGKRAEEALRKSEAEYRLLVENANEAITVACDGKLRFVNPKFVEIMGYSREELISRPFIDFIHPDDRQIVLERYVRRLRGEQVPEVYPFRIIDKDGNTKWLEISAVLISWEGRPATLNFMNNVTEHKKAEEEVKRSRAELRRLSAHLQSVLEGERKRIAHEIHDELGQQLTALKMDLSWIGRNLPENEKPLLEKIRAMSKLIDTTIETVRKISTDLRPAILDDFGLLAAIEWQLKEFQQRTGIKCKIAQQSNDVILDQGRAVALFRIVQEALTNVARHANAMNVEVTLKEGDGRVLLQIKDNGRGVKEEEITSSKSIGIVGMRERARLYGGQMRIKGIPGKGTTVKVSIPLKEEEPSAEDTGR